MISPRLRHAILLIVLLGGGAVRFAAVSYGLPRHDLGQDEMITALRVRHGVLVGHAGWPRFHWPNLNVHMSRAVVDATRWVEAKAGLAGHDEFWIGRMMTALLGTLTLLALYFAAARLFDPLVGLAAAGLLAAVPLHAFRSRLWVPDVPMTFFYTLALLAAVGILARPTYTRFVAAAVAIGLATASKYNGAGACLPVVVAGILALPLLGERWRVAALLNRLALAGALAVAVFFAADPYALPLFDQMLEGMGFIRGLYIDTPTSALPGVHNVSYIARAFFASGYEGVGPLISLLAIAGGVALAVRRSRAGLLAWLPGLLYLLVFSSFLPNPYERMFLPLAPHIAMLAAVALVGGARWLAARRGRRATAAPAAAAMVLAGLLVCALPVTGHAVASRGGETRIRAGEWLDANVPAGAFVFREWDMTWPSADHFEFNRTPEDLWAEGWTPRVVSSRWDFVVTTSTNFRRVRRQRRRPSFARQASYYDELFDGPLFELAARFEPDLRTFGPEVRIYRSLAPSGRLLGPAKSSVELLRGRPWVSHQELREESAEGLIVRFGAAREQVAGKVTLRPEGWYVLEVDAESATAAPLELGLGTESRSVRIEGPTTVKVRAFRRRGKSWWRVGTGPGFAVGDEVVVRSVRLRRQPGVAALGASAETAGPKIVTGGSR